MQMIGFSLGFPEIVLHCVYYLFCEFYAVYIYIRFRVLLYLVDVRSAAYV